MILTETSWAGVGLAGNPSDGCFGKAVAVPAANFSASVTLFESPEIFFAPTVQDHATFTDLADLSNDVEAYGYYGGIRLLKAATKVFVEYCDEIGIDRAKRNFTARYQSTIPRRVGLAESSAVVTAMLRALARFYDAPVDPQQLPLLAWRTERDELGVPCGLMDRVMQTYGKPVYMDLNREAIEEKGYGTYCTIPEDRIPPLYMAVPASPRSNGGEDYHRALSVRLQQEGSDLPEQMEEFAALADEAREALDRRDSRRLGGVMDRNFDLRHRLFPLSEAETAVVEAARNLGMSAKLAGGRGTVVGLCLGDQCLDQLSDAVRPYGYTVDQLRLA